jgi:membrane protease YdiL (CAAX protease family)
MWAWLGLVAVVTILNYATRLTGGEEDDRSEILYEYGTAIGGAVFYLVMLTIVVFIARGLPRREVFALRRPPSWIGAGARMAVALVVIWAANAALTYGLDLRAGDEQGIVPDEWDPDRAGAFVANFAVIALVGPVVEELSYRGLGYWAVRAVYGVAAAILVTSLLFGASHGLVAGLPALTVFGLAAAWLRQSTNSIYPPTILHVAFNGLALIAAVTLDTEL